MNPKKTKHSQPPSRSKSTKGKSTAISKAARSVRAKAKAGTPSNSSINRRLKMSAKPTSESKQKSERRRSSAQPLKLKEEKSFPQNPNPDAKNGPTYSKKEAFVPKAYLDEAAISNIGSNGAIPCTSTIHPAAVATPGWQELEEFSPENMRKYKGLSPPDDNMADEVYKKLHKHLAANEKRMKREHARMEKEKAFRERMELKQQKRELKMELKFLKEKRKWKKILEEEDQVKVGPYFQADNIKSILVSRRLPRDAVVHHLPLIEDEEQPSSIGAAIAPASMPPPPMPGPSKPRTPAAVATTESDSFSRFSSSSPQVTYYAEQSSKKEGFSIHPKRMAVATSNISESPSASATTNGTGSSGLTFEFVSAAINDAMKSLRSRETGNSSPSFNDMSCSQRNALISFLCSEVADKNQLISNDYLKNMRGGVSFIVYQCEVQICSCKMLKKTTGNPVCFKCRKSNNVNKMSRSMQKSTKPKEMVKQKICKKCDRNLPTPSALRMHMRIFHPRDLQRPTFTCFECKKCFGRKSSLKLHLKTPSHPKNPKDGELIASLLSEMIDCVVNYETEDRRIERAVVPESESPEEDLGQAASITKNDNIENHEYLAGERTKMKELKERLGFTEEMEQIIREAIGRGPAAEVVATVKSPGGKTSVTRMDMQTLCFPKWLNGQIIEAYMRLIMNRSVDNPNLPSVYAFSTYFFTKLMQEADEEINQDKKKPPTYSNSFKRWTKNVNIFDYDLIMVPIFIESKRHWCLACVDMRTQTMTHYDSLGIVPDVDWYNNIFNFISHERREKRQKKLVGSKWSLKLWVIPVQMNQDDCGVFCCWYADCVSNGNDSSIFPWYTPHQRYWMVMELATGVLM